MSFIRLNPKQDPIVIDKSQLGGGLSLTSIQTSTYNAKVNDYVQGDPSGGSFNVNLPSTAVINDVVAVANITGSINSINVIPAGGQTLATPDGTLAVPAFTSYTLTFNGTTWIVA
jgi:hypothetical protein